MPNTTGKITAAAFSLAAAACSFFSAEEIDGCMYLRGRAVNVRCLNDVIGFGAENPGAYYPAKAFESCTRGEYATYASASSTIFYGENGRQSVRAACLFEGSTSRNYYRWDEAVGKLYVLYLSCAEGCVSISDVYDLEFSAAGVKATLLGTYKE